MASTPDYRTYPGDRNTRLTPAQREKKIDAASGKLYDAVLLLKEVCGDFSANGYRLTVAQRAEWRTAARACDTAREALRAMGRDL